CVTATTRRPTRTTSVSCTCTARPSPRSRRCRRPTPTCWRTGDPGGRTTTVPQRGPDRRLICSGAGVVPLRKTRRPAVRRQDQPWWTRRPLAHLAAHRTVLCVRRGKPHLIAG